MMRSNNRVSACLQPARALAAQWGRLLLGLSLLLVAAACSTTPASIGVGLPSVDPTTGAYLVDTLTLRSSTVLRDSVITSTSNYLLVGRYVDPQLGTITANSYSTLNLGGAFTPDRSYIADSIVLVLKPDTYRYGDTTKTQTLVEVRELNSFLPLYSYGYASPRLTPMTLRVNAPLLNAVQPIPVRRAPPKLNNIRLRLTNNFRDRFMDAGKAGQLSTQDQLDGLCVGLALRPGANDAAALLRLDASSTDQALMLYYHDPADITTPISHVFALNNRHFYQAEAVRPSLLSGLSQPSVPVDAAKTAQQTYIEGLLGLETKIEIPYLYDLRNYGQHFIITSAVMTAQVPSNTLGYNLPPPAAIRVATTDVNNRVGTTFVSSALYSSAITSIDGIEHAGYSWSVQSYIQNALSNNIANNGMLLGVATSTNPEANPTLPNRVVLGSASNNGNKLQLRLYIIRND